MQQSREEELMVTASLPGGLSVDDVERAVRERYSQVGAHPEGAYNFRVGRAFAEALGYPSELLDQLPPSVWEAFTGVAAPSLAVPVRLGDTVVDLGCGGGLDLILASWAVGPRGRVIGVDWSPGMVERARRNISLLGLVRTEVVERPVAACGLPSGVADWVLANGILNLSPDKGLIVREVARLLKPGGRFLLAEITLGEPLAPETVASLDDWFR
ncbi:MAG: methyltransferase domain-containing protein [Chloroflexota bacterium]